MTQLGDYLGHLLGEISKARVQADLESVNIAKLYAENELLKTFPVPRVRLPNIELNVPVVVEAAEMQKVYKTDDVDKRQIVSETYSVLRDKLAKTYRKDFNRTEFITMNRQLFSSVNELVEKIDTQNNFDQAETAYIHQITSKVNTVKSIRRSKTNDKFNAEIAKEVHEVLENNIQSPYEKLSRVHIAPETHKQKELGDTQKALTLKLSITEEAIEWVETEGDDGKTKQFLVSE